MQLLVGYDGGMPKPKQPAIVRLVEHYHGPVALADRLGEGIVYQEVQRWVRRGWAAPKHFLRLLPLAEPIGIRIADLYADIDKAKEASAA